MRNFFYSEECKVIINYQQSAVHVHCFISATKYSKFSLFFKNNKVQWQLTNLMILLFYYMLVSKILFLFCLQQKNMAQETNQTPGPMLCSTGCGFYGNPRTNGMCSVCYKEHLQRQQNSGRMSPMGKLFPRNNPFEELVDRKQRPKNWGLRLRMLKVPGEKTQEKLEI